MNDRQEQAKPARSSAGMETDAAPRRIYERPRVVWREAYEPVSFGVSCAKDQGNPGCGPGPFSI
jgi:hypothetical protein